jgi:phenylalanyl-tRNA synthetase beta chain
MKLYKSILEKFIELPTQDVHELRRILDDVGLEVKSIETKNHDTVFTIETLANRGDHLSALGVARELSARFLCQTKLPSFANLGDQKTHVIVRKNTEFCLRYGLLEITTPSDCKLRDDISAIIESDHKKHAIVDVLNYTALELGQPMHAFDKEKIDGEVIVELTTQSETIEALDGKTYTVPPDSIVIKDRKKIIAVAGVIGCSNSMVEKNSTRILIESATFDPIKVRKTARAMGISTDASHAFERGVDIEMVIPALRRALYLAQDGTANSANLVGHILAESVVAEKRIVTIRLNELKQQVNSPRLNESELFSRLKNLGYHVSYDAASKAKTFSVVVPSWRLWDVKNEEDIVEDFARSHGLNEIKQKLPPLDYEAPEKNPQDLFLEKIEPSLIGAGFHEVITKSFYSADDALFIESLNNKIQGKHITLKNSIESSFSHLRTTTVLHLASVAAQNLKMGVTTIKVYEYSRVFEKRDQESVHNQNNSPVNEIETLSLIVSGRWFDSQWRQPESQADLFSLTKGVIENLFGSLNKNISLKASKNPFLHPGMQAAILCGRSTIGTLGVLHPHICSRYEIKVPTIFVELETEEMMKRSEVAPYKAPNDLPVVRRDLTLSLPLTSFAGDIVRSVSNGEFSDVIEMHVIDDFKKPEEDFRRVTYRITFQNEHKTLESAAVDATFTSILALLESKHAAKLAA